MTRPLSRLATVPFLLIAVLSTATAHAVPIAWQFTAEFDDVSVGGADLLGIDGDTLTIDLTFDTTQTWSPALDVPALVASAQVSGHVVTLNSPTPAMAHPFGNLITVLAQDVGTTNFADLIVDGTFATMGGFQGSSLTLPTAGQALAADHLMRSFAPGSVQQITGSGFSYQLINRTIRVGSVPLAATAPLLFAGAVGWLALRRRATPASGTIARNNRGTGPHPNAYATPAPTLRRPERREPTTVPPIAT